MRQIPKNILRYLEKLKEENLIKDAYDYEVRSFKIESCVENEHIVFTPLDGRMIHWRCSDGHSGETNASVKSVEKIVERSLFSSDPARYLK